jgi:hypothetical protein
MMIEMIPEKNSTRSKVSPNTSHMIWHSVLTFGGGRMFVPKYSLRAAVSFPLSPAPISVFNSLTSPLTPPSSLRSSRSPKDSGVRVR